MTPGQTRVLLAGFGLVAFGVAFNALLLQPAPQTTAAARAAAEKAQQKATAERLKRLALEVPPPIQPPLQAGSAAPDPRTFLAPAPIPFDQLSRRIAEAPGPPLGQPAPQARIAAAVRAPEDAPVRVARLKPDAAAPEAMPHAPDAEGDPETIRAVQRELTHRGYGPLQADGVPGLITRAAIMAFEHDSRIGLTGEATEALLKRLLLGASGDRSAEAGAGKVRSPQAEMVIRTVQQSLTQLGYQPGRVDGRVGEETERAIREFELDQGLVPSGRVSAELFSRLARAVSGGKAAVRTR
jgi:peptidoglycan hydrolase-like protein with peptidoglycan-binding domain